MGFLLKYIKTCIYIQYYGKSEKKISIVRLGRCFSTVLSTVLRLSSGVRVIFLVKATGKIGNLLFYLLLPAVLLRKLPCNH